MPLRAGGYRLFSAHQMGTCRMGADPATSVANPEGELHDTPGVWMGDGSAFPTSSGTNPMITIMALARRTGEAILASARPRPRRRPPEEADMATATEALVRDRLFIGGEWVEPAGDGTIEVINPSTEEVMGSMPEGTPEDVDRAVKAARDAFDSWSRPSPTSAPAARRRSAQLAERGDEIAALMATELGMPVKLGAHDPGRPSHRARSPPCPSSWSRSSGRRQVGNSLIVREPVGVVAAITPWNYPLHQIALKVAPALAAGCTVALKPSEVAPLNAFVLAEIMEAVGLPAGVFNLVTGTGPVVGEAIVSTREMDMISFTGSTRPGAACPSWRPQHVKPVALELGGKSPNVILDDADLEHAVADGVAKCFLNSGQTCSALTRMLVPRERLAEVEKIAAAVAEQFTPGDSVRARPPGSGPLVSDTQLERVRGYIKKGQEEGARLVTGGAEPPEGLEQRLLRAARPCSPT